MQISGINMQKIEAECLDGVESLEEFKGNVNACIKLGVGGLCVPSSYLTDRDLLKYMVGSQVPMVATIGWPTGTGSIQGKIAEIVEIEQWANALDVVINTDFIRMHAWEEVHREVVEIMMHSRSPIRFVLDVPRLTDPQIIRVFDIVAQHDGSISTATGMYGHTSVYHVELLKDCIFNSKKDIMLKVSNGARNKSEIHRMFDAGADVVAVDNLAIFED